MSHSRLHTHILNELYQEINIPLDKEINRYWLDYASFQPHKTKNVYLIPKYGKDCAISFFKNELLFLNKKYNKNFARKFLFKVNMIKSEEHHNKKHGNIYTEYVLNVTNIDGKTFDLKYYEEYDSSPS